MQHFQFFAPERKLALVPSPIPQKLSECLKRLDRAVVKNTIVVPLLYVWSAKDAEFRENTGPDPVFTEFTQSLGLMLDPPRMQTGNFDHLRHLVRTSATIYDTNMLTELVFLTPSLRFVHASSVFGKVVDESEIVVIWNARRDEKSDTRLPLLLSALAKRTIAPAKVAIVVTPLRRGLFRINVLSCRPEAIVYGIHCDCANARENSEGSVQSDTEQHCGEQALATDDPEGRVHRVPEVYKRRDRKPAVQVLGPLYNPAGGAETVCLILRESHIGF